MTGDGARLWALARSGDASLTVFERTPSGWREHALPERSVRDEKTTAAIGGRGGVLAVLLGARLWRLEGERWSSRAVPARPRANQSVRTLLDGRRLYVARDDGEWGGDLVSIDIDAGSWNPEVLSVGGRDPDVPVRDVARGPDGSVWAVRGLAHLVMSQGALFRRDARGWSLVASASGATGLGEAGECGGDWNLPATNFDALAFDAAGNVLVSTGSLGLVRREARGGWTRLDARKRRFAYNEGLQVVGAEAIVGTFDAGAFVWDLASGQVTRVRLSPAENDPR